MNLEPRGRWGQAQALFMGVPQGALKTSAPWLSSPSTLGGINGKLKSVFLVQLFTSHRCRHWMGPVAALMTKESLWCIWSTGHPCPPAAAFCAWWWLC